MSSTPADASLSVARRVVPTTPVLTVDVGWRLRPSVLAATAGAMGAAAAAGVLVAITPRVAIGAALVLTLMAAVWARPAAAAYLVIGLTPLTAGIDRGRLLPVLRPNEALALVLGVTLAARGMARLRTGRQPQLRVSPVEWSLVLMAVASSFLPLLWMVVRRVPVTGDDIQYALVLWKYLGVYLIVRTSVHTERQVRVCLWVSMAAACIVGIIAILQSLHLLGLAGLLSSYYTINGNTGALSAGRGSSTLALPAAVADLMIFNLAIAMGLLLQGSRHRPRLAMLSVLFVLAAVSAGEFSSTLGLVVGAVTVVVVTRQYRLFRWFPLIGLLGAVSLWPVIQTRLEGFQSASGLPVSWTGRLFNLENYFWPQVFHSWNFVLGVRPAARVALSGKANGYVWIESGYTWLLWAGGLVMFASFILFVVVTVRLGMRAVRTHPDAIGVAGLALVTAIMVVTALMLFDPHLTYRGVADSLYGLAALAGVGSHARTMIREPTPAPAAAA